MSSAYSSVRARDGFCGFYDIYLSFSDSCPSHTRAPSLPLFFKWFASLRVPPGQGG